MTTGLLRLLPADEAPAARLHHRADFVHRYTALMGYPPAESDCDRWWPRSGGTAVDHGPA